MIHASAQRSEIAEAANVLSRLGLVTAFGHVSARVSAPAGDSMLITPAADLADVTAADLLEVPLRAPDSLRASDPLPPGAPAEAWAHLALYRARPDAAAVARAQPPSAYAAAATARSLVPLHGQAAWLGESIPVHDSATLLRSPGLAERAARCLPTGEALLLRGNGAVTLGATAGIAVARMWLLAAACDVYLAAHRAGDAVTPLSAEEIASWRAAAGELLPRLWQHLRRGRRTAAPTMEHRAAARAAHGSTDDGLPNRVRGWGGHDNRRHIGSGMIGGTVARLSVAAGHHVVPSNPRRPGHPSRGSWPNSARSRPPTPASRPPDAGELVVVAIPVKAIGDVPAKPLASRAAVTEFLDSIGYGTADTGCSRTGGARSRASSSTAADTARSPTRWGRPSALRRSAPPGPGRTRARSPRRARHPVLRRDSTVPGHYRTRA